MEDSPEVARALINHQTQSHLYGFDGNETCSPGTISLAVRADPYNVITKFYVVDVESPHNAILGRSWLNMMKVVSFTHIPPIVSIYHSNWDDRHQRISSCR